jgi:DNA polymerase elongation subunit (family B)
MDIVVPQQQRERSLPLDGAYVKEPVPGWYEDGGSVDATSLYPSNIITNNISPETYEGNIGLTIDEALMRRDHGIVDRVVTPVGAIYSKAKRGILPELVEHFMKRRKSVKGEMLRLEQLYEDTKDESLKNKIAALDNEQMAIKISLNSLYGATANEHFRFFKYDHAASITLTGQFVLRTIEERIDRELNQLFGTGEAKYLIYIDTDSLYFTFKPVMDKFKVPDSAKIKAIEKTILEKVTPIVNAICADCCKYMNSYENRLNFKLEIAFDKAIWVGKKKYAIRAHSSEGVTYSKPKFKVKGLEMVRSSTPRFVRDKLKDALELIFNGTEKEVQRCIESVRSDFMKLPYQQTAFPRSANNLDEYSDKKYIYVSSKTGAKGATTPIQVRGALLYNHYLKEMGLDGKYPLIGEGEKIKFCYLRLPNRLRENIISFPAEGVIPDEFGVVKQVDSDMQFEKTFLASMEILLDAIKWSAIEHSSLEDFFA